MLLVLCENGANLLDLQAVGLYVILLEAYVCCVIYILKYLATSADA